MMIMNYNFKALKCAEKEINFFFENDKSNKESVGIQ